jgi:hypothetical protein
MVTFGRLVENWYGTDGEVSVRVALATKLRPKKRFSELFRKSLHRLTWRAIWMLLRRTHTSIDESRVSAGADRVCTTRLNESENSQDPATSVTSTTDSFAESWYLFTFVSTVLFHKIDLL